MNTMASIRLFFLILTSLLVTCSFIPDKQHNRSHHLYPATDDSESNTTYLAAVYEHLSFDFIWPFGIATRHVAMKIMDINLDVFMKQAALAAIEGAKIIVFPEYGVTGLGLSRDQIVPFSEAVPSPDTNHYINPCSNDTRQYENTVLQKLSCIAKENSVVVVANMATIYGCTKSKDPNCPNDGRYQYNTNVAFLSDGRYVARYFKINLFAGEKNVFQVGSTGRENYGIFETDFGLFGMMTCFDVLFSHPALDLVASVGVKNIAFPTAWMNVLPLLTAVEFHQSFAISHDVNFLASNQHLPIAEMTGSGLYAGELGAVAYHYDMLSYEGKLVVGRLPVRPRHHATIYENFLTLQTFNQSDASDMRSNLPRVVKTQNRDDSAIASKRLSINNKAFGTNTQFIAEMNDDPYTFVALRDDKGSVNVCNNGLCCNLVYEKRQNGVIKELYALGAFTGLHTTDGKYYLQVCALIKCKLNLVSHCGEAETTAHTIFDKFDLSGNFTLAGEVNLFPEVLTSGVELAPIEREWSTQAPFNRIWSEQGVSRPILVAAIYGRRFDKDPVSTQ
ncbi:pantetheinase-like [Glandiceps talaboti]